MEAFFFLFFLAQTMEASCVLVGCFQTKPDMQPHVFHVLSDFTVIHQKK